MDAGVAPEPDPLAAGEPPRAPDGEVDGLVEGQLAGQVREQLLVPERLAGRARQTARAAPPAPGPRRRSRLRAGPGSGPRCARRPRRRASRSADEHERRGGYASSPGPKLENGTPAPRVTSSARTTRRRFAGLHPAGGDRVERGQPRVERRRVGLGVELGADLGVLAGDGEVVDDGPQVEARCRRRAALGARVLDAGDGGAGGALEAGDREVLVGSAMSMRWCGPRPARRRSAWRCRCPCPGTPASRRPTRARRRAAPGQLEGERRLARRGGADEGEMPGHRAALGEVDDRGRGARAGG